MSDALRTAARLLTEGDPSLLHDHDCRYRRFMRGTPMASCVCDCTLPARKQEQREVRESVAASLLRMARDAAPSPEPPRTIAEAMGITVTPEDEQAYRDNLAQIAEAEAAAPAPKEATDG